MRLSLGLADCSSEERCCDTNPHKHILYLPPSDMRAQIFIFLDFFKEYKRKITPLSLSFSSAHGKIINALPKRARLCRNAFVCRSGAWLKDNKPGTVLCFTAIKTHPIWHALWCLQSPSKTSSYTLNSACRKTQVLRGVQRDKIQPHSYACPISYSQRYSRC